jgi:hypothetical protein
MKNKSVQLFTQNHSKMWFSTLILSTFLVMVQRTTAQAPVAAPGPPCEICGCSFCPKGFMMMNPAGVITVTQAILDEFGAIVVSGQGQTLETVLAGFGIVAGSALPCQLLNSAATGGLFPAEVCIDQLRLNPIIRNTCGCPALPKAPTKAPVKAPTKAPVKAPTKAPVKSPTMAPALAPTKAPVKAPATAPTKAPVTAPAPVPTMPVATTPTAAPKVAPVAGVPTTKAPVIVAKPTTGAPVAAPVVPPVSTTTPPGRCVRRKRQL